MKVLAIDQSTAVCGWAVGSLGDSLEAYRFGSFKVHGNPFGKKLFCIHLKLYDLISSFDPDEIVYEDPFFPIGQKAFNVDVVKKLQRVAGTIDCLAAMRNLPLTTYRPQSWRKTALKAGRAPKGEGTPWLKLAMMTRARMLGYKVKNNDEADALGLLIHHLTGKDPAKKRQAALL